MTERLAAVSVDLDEVACYAAIHGVRAPEGPAAHAVWDRCVPRFERLFEALGVPATFFVVGRDLRRDGAAAAAARLHGAGHELGNHTEDHLYDLVRRPEPEVRAQVARGAASIAAVTGAPPRGFRAPGYTVDDALFRALAASGVAYDSSVFPCPAYYAAKSAAIALYAALGRPSRSIADDPRVLLAPADPYRVGTPYWRRGEGLIELPIGVTRAATGRLPFIGTSVVLAGERGARRLARATAGRPLVSLELHGIDLADAAADGLSPLAAHQPDLRVPGEAKARALRAALETLRAEGYRFVTCAEAAARV